MAWTPMPRPTPGWVSFPAGHGSGTNGSWRTGTGVITSRWRPRSRKRSGLPIWGGAVLKAAAAAAGVNQSTGYRWLYRRFMLLRSPGSRPRGRAGSCGSRRLNPSGLGGPADKQHRAGAKGPPAAGAPGRDPEARGSPPNTRPGPWSAAQARRAVRETRYWELVNAGVSDARACRMLGMSRNIGTRLRNRRAAQPPGQAGQSSGRYLSLRERLQYRGPAATGLFPAPDRAGTRTGPLNHQAGAGPAPGRAGPVPAAHRRP